MIWWVEQFSRTKTEREEIAALEAGSSWLENIHWRLGKELRLIADFDLIVGDERFELKLIYPEFFPATPPMVKPRDAKRISDHQYGQAGELCLEFRPDNWVESISGAMMIESAWRLLSGQQSEQEPQPVPDAHFLTEAQQLRGSKFRFLIDEAVEAELVKLAAGAHQLRIAWQSLAGTFSAQLLTLGETIESKKLLPNASEYDGTAVRLPPGISLPAITAEAIQTLLVELGHDALAAKIDHPTDNFYLLLIGDSGLSFCLIFRSDGKPLAVPFDACRLKAQESRLPQSYETLGSKSVAILGCGSVGSKIAASLARAGVAKFILVDGDLFQPGNLVRNELDCRFIGWHKTDALEQRIREINGDAEVIVYRSALDDQQSAGSLATILKKVGNCDLIIDATADASVFNLAGLAARRSKTAFLWIEVYAGGIGGLVARCRPGVDPIPSLARAQISKWCERQGVEAPPMGGAPYDLSQGDAPPLIADDADVGVLAAHGVRMALDTLLGSETSAFPSSAYFIGLSKAWLFTAPFDTRPVDLTPEGEWGLTIEPHDAEAISALIDELGPKKDQA